MAFNTKDTSRKIGSGVGADHDLQPPDKVPGKTTHVVDGPGSDYVNEGTACQAGNGGVCIFEDGQRQRMIQEFTDRVGSAKTNYQVALTLIALDKLTEKPREMSMWGSLFLTALGLGAGYVLGKVLDEITTMGAESFQKSVTQMKLAKLHYVEPKVRVQMGNAAYEKLTALAGAGVFLKLISKSFGEVRTSVSDAHVAGMGQKQLEQTFLLQLQDDGSRSFAHVREEQLAKADDAELIALWRSFEDRWHSVSMYKELLSEKLEAFKKSSVLTIGRDAKTEHAPAIEGQLPADVTRDNAPASSANGGSPYTNGGGGARDRFVVRLVFDSGATSVFAYADKYIPAQTVFDIDRKEGDEHGYANNEENVAADPPRHGDYRGHPIKYVLNNFNIVGLVEEEFVGIALEKQPRMWGAPPSAILIRDRYGMGHGNAASFAKDPNNPMLGGAYTVTNKLVNWSNPKTWGMRENSKQ